MTSGSITLADIVRGYTSFEFAGVLSVDKNGNTLFDGRTQELSVASPTVITAKEQGGELFVSGVIQAYSEAHAVGRVLNLRRLWKTP